MIKSRKVVEISLVKIYNERQRHEEKMYKMKADLEKMYKMKADLK